MSSPGNILVVEDEAHLAQGLLFNLRAEGYTVQLAVDGETALEMIAGDSIDAIILDVMLPGRDGFSVAAELRSQQNFVPILMLTAKDAVEDRIAGQRLERARFGNFHAAVARVCRAVGGVDAEPSVALDGDVKRIAGLGGRACLP